MGKFDAVIEKYTRSGVSTDNVEYSIIAIKNGSKREYILENLTADYRGMTHEQATAMLEDLFAANGGEFKRENQGGYLFGIIFLIIGIACSVYTYNVLMHGGILITWIAAAGVLGIAGASVRQESKAS